MSPLLEVRPLSSEESGRLHQADREKIAREDEEMKNIERILSQEGGVALDFYKNTGVFEEGPDVLEQFKEMRGKILKHFRRSTTISETELSFDYTLEGNKGTLFVRR